MTQPGVGPNTALAYVLTIGEVSRFRRGKQVASYLGLIPREQSSGGRQRAGIDHQAGQPHAAQLLVEAASGGGAARPDSRNQYLHRCHQKPKAVAKVATARKLAVRLYWMLRRQKRYPEIVRIESSLGCPGRRKLDRRVEWALSHPQRKIRTAGCSHRRIMAEVTAESMVGGTMFAANDSA